jgi:DNA-binding MarR family transcriptional regulator
MSQPPWLTNPCACANVRRLGRLVTRLYDDEMRPAGMEVGQFTLLATIRHFPGISQAHIAGGLGMDTTSLTRTLKVLLKHRWIEKAHGADRRSRVFAITDAGESQLLQARPYWQRAQARFTSLVGADAAKTLVEAVAGAALALNTEVGDLRRARRRAGTRTEKAHAVRPGAPTRGPRPR